jgi:hypothetical protein
MDNKETPHTEPEKEARAEITDKKILGNIDAKKIPTGYGAVCLDPEKSEFLLTNDVGDVMLFIDPSTRNMSTMELKELKWDAGAFLSGLKDLPQEYQSVMEKAKMPKKFHVTKSPEGTEFVHAIGKGTLDKPLKVVQRSTHVYKDISLVHLAVIKHVFITQQPVTVLLNSVVFTYTPKRSNVEIKASTTFHPPREFDDIDRDLKADKPVSVIEYDYHAFLTKNQDIFKDPTEWYREDYYGYGLNMANAMFEKVEERVNKKDL